MHETLEGKASQICTHDAEAGCWHFGFLTLVRVTNGKLRRNLPFGEFQGESQVIALAWKLMEEFPPHCVLGIPFA